MLGLRSPDEGLEGGALGVDAQRHTLSLLVLADEAMDQLWETGRQSQPQPTVSMVTRRRAPPLTFALPHGQQAVLVAVAERALSHRLEVAGVHAPAGDGVAALAHAGVVAQAALVQVGVGQGVAAGDPLGLGGDDKGHNERLGPEPGP